MKKKTKILFSLIAIFFITIIFNTTKVNAASASVSASSTKVTTGTTVTITTTIKGAAWQISLSGAVSASYADNTDDAEDSTKTYTTTFTPSSSGTYTVKLSGNVTGSNDTSATTVSDSVTITVTDSSSSASNSSSNSSSSSSSSTSSGSSSNLSSSTSSSSSTTANTSTGTTTKTKSSNANLSNLGITPNDFSGFKSGTLNYNATVPYSVEQVKVYATSADSNATITGTGTQNLNVGENSLKVVVTAEDGTTKKTYTINVTRLETDEEETEEETEDEAIEISGDLIKLEVTGYTLSPEFEADIYEYALDLTEDLSSLDIVTEGVNENISIEIVGNENLQDGENIITIMVYNNETEKTSVYQIIVNKSVNIDLGDVNTTLTEALQKENLIRYIVTGVIIFIIICIIIFIIARRRYLLKLENDKYEYDDEDRRRNEEDDDENTEEKIDLDEDAEFFERINNSIARKNREQEAKEENNDDKIEEQNIQNADEEIKQQNKRNPKRKGKHFE